jgi:enediyne polyketide synthase
VVLGAGDNAGRVCDHLDLAGGGYTVSAFLLSIVDAVKSLTGGDLDVALAGGRGIVVLMRESDALARRCRIYASITGWGVSSSRGGALAVSRAYERAGYGVDTVSYLEATGVDGLITAALAVYHQVIPPHPTRADAGLWPAGLPVRAGVSATGAGGTSVHVALEEAPGRERRAAVSRRTRALVAGRQDAELLLVDAHSAAELRARLTRLAATLSYAELTDVAGALAFRPRGGAFRAAVVATNAADAAAKLTRLANADGSHPSGGVFMAHRTGAPRVAFLFPGRGSGRPWEGAIRRRFTVAERVLGCVPECPAGEVARPRVVAGSVAGLRVLHTLGIEADVAVGDGVGELTALSWAGGLDGGGLLRLATVRGAVPAGRFHFGRPRRPVVSTVTGRPLLADVDLRTLLTEQLTEPARFDAAAAAAVAGADLVIEVGPGRALTDLVSQLAPHAEVLALDTDSPSLTPLLSVVAAAFALGVDIDPTALFADRIVRPISEASPIPHAGAFTIDTKPTALFADRARPIAETPPTPHAGAFTLDTEPTALFADGTRPIAETPPTPRAGAFTLDTEPTALFADGTRPIAEAPAGPHGAASAPDVDPAAQRADQTVRPTTKGPASPHEVAPANSPSFTPQLPAAVTLGVEPTADRVVRTATEPASPAEVAPATTAGDGADGVAEVPGYAPWVRPFSLTYVPTDRPPPGIGGGSPGAWSVYAPPRHPLAGRLRAALVAAALGDGVLLCLPASGEAHADLFRRAGRKVAEAAPDTRFVVVQQDFGAAGLARTLRLEHPSIRTTVVSLADVAPTGPRAVEAAVARVVGDVTATTGFSEVRYTPAGIRTAPVLSVLPDPAPDQPSPLGPDDVLLVTGGATGVVAECALALARDSGAQLALLGAADPADVDRMAAAGVRVRHEQADVDGIERAVERLGPVTAVLHGGPPAVEGLRAVLAAVGEDRVRLLVTFGSVVGRTGLRGEADHATAADWLTELTVHFGQQHPEARVLALEWPARDAGIEVLRRVLADPSAGPVVVVSGRAAGLPTVRAELPVTRFVDRVLVHYQGVELVTETELTTDRDPYLADHQLDGDPLFPAVFGMEAMAQVAAALRGTAVPPVLEEVEFLRPIVVRPGGATTIRLVALAGNAETVAVAIRTDATRFATDHVRARLRFARTGPPTSPAAPATVLPEVPVDPVAELYGDYLFQGKRFQRLLSYRKIAARHVVAELSTTGAAPWYTPTLPQDHVLADPGTRDAVLHAIQGCVPDATLLPQGVDRLHPADPADPSPGVVVVDARERAHDGDTFTYDVDVLTTFGELVERWEGLTLRAVHRRGGAGPWVAPLLGPYLERATEEVLGGARAVVVEPDPLTGPLEAADRRAQTELAASRALGRRAGVRYGPDGRPEVDGAAVSTAHGGGLTLVVTGAGPLAGDLEVVTERVEDDWATLLGHGLAVRDLVTGEPAAVAATRVWSVLECLRKAGLPGHAVTLDRVTPDGRVVFAAGGARIATWVTAVHGSPGPVVFAFLAGEET